MGGVGVPCEEQMQEKQLNERASKLGGFEQSPKSNTIIVDEALLWDDKVEVQDVVMGLGD